MKIRKSMHEDIQSMMKLVRQAQAYFRNHHIDQWQDGYPNEVQLSGDISKGKSYVLEDRDIVGTMYFSIENDKTYDVIDGKWLTSKQPYAVIHRIVVDENMKGVGLAKQLLDYAIEQCLNHDVLSIRIDTHEDNLSMQHFLKKHDFLYCGVIYLESGAKRIAFEKVLNK